MLKASILSIGDEICIGQIVNTNAAWIAKQVTRSGAFVERHVSVGDNAEDMKRELEHLLQISDFVILTGGLGPTHDDITKPVLIDFFNDELIFNESTYKNILELLERRGLKPTGRLKQMAMLPKSCTPLKNAVGTAPGMLFERNRKYIISMPGVPNEMKYIMNNSVIPLIVNIIKERNDDLILYKTLLTSGVPESVLADKIGNVNDFLISDNASLAFLPSYKGVRLRIGVKANNSADARNEIERIEKYIRQRVDALIIADNDIPLAEVIGKILSETNRTLAVAESCTGGLLGGEFTTIPGSSIYFLGGIIAYSNNIKENILNVRHDTLVSYGAVSKDTAHEMAANVRQLFGSDYGISITGIAGPDGGTPEKPVGTVWIGISSENTTMTERYTFDTDRDINRQRAVGTALNLLYQTINPDKK
jgi:nicotinamide-nucleotide amidase